MQPLRRGGATIKLQWAPIEMVVGWDHFAKDDMPCPVVITPYEIDAAVKLGEELEMADKNEELCPLRARDMGDRRSV